MTYYSDFLKNNYTYILIIYEIYFLVNFLISSHISWKKMTPKTYGYNFLVRSTSFVTLIIVFAPKDLGIKVDGLSVHIS
jgi:hypothetical protein